MTAARCLPTDTAAPWGRNTTAHRLFPAAHYRIADDRLKDAFRRRWRGRAPPGP